MTVSTNFDEIYCYCYEDIYAEASISLNLIITGSEFFYRGL